MIKIIKTEDEYRAALAEIERLVDRDPPRGTSEAEHLELLTILVQDYEARKFPAKLPDPIEAIRFRMEQQGLTQRDLVPYLGSRSKVSEVLARKRPLTLSMIRALHTGLGIPAKALLQENDAELLRNSDVEFDRFPVGEMIARGWIEGLTPGVRAEPELAVRRFLEPLGRSTYASALYRKTRHVRSGRSMDKYALMAWTLRIVIRALGKSFWARDKVGTVTPESMREVAQLSWSARGPLLAQEFLEKHGIPLIIEPHLSHTHLDGAAVLIELDKPVIGLTLRHDRLDNFWFCLMHELAHVALHLKSAGDGFYDDLDAENNDDSSEKEADELAREVLVPTELWNKSPARHLRSPEAAQHLAEQLRIHPAIVAGRMRYEAKNFRILNQLVGRDEVRPLFSEVNWPGKEG